MLTQWLGTPIQNASVWSLLTPNLNQTLTTINDLSSFTINTVAGVIINVGYNPNLVDSWTKV